MSDALVLHLAAPPGGGVDRYVRDLSRTSALRHAFWHVAPATHAVEVPCGGTVWALDAEAVRTRADEVHAWLRTLGVGALHVHSMAAEVRGEAQAIAQALGVPIVATLHDVLFLDPRGFGAEQDVAVDREWIAEVAPFLRACRAVLAPSRFIADLARAHVEGLAVDVVPNGIEADAPRAVRRPRAAFAARAPRHVAAVIGAIGPHKGSDTIAEIAQALAGSDIALVLIGYLDAQVQPGWRGEHLFVHGPFAEPDLAAWLDAYDARVVVFPNRVPESFSYALSEAWAASRPVIVPDQGALGERVREHGGGWTLPAGSPGTTYASILTRLFGAAGAGEVARVQSTMAPDDAARVPRLADMTRSLDALYRHFGLDPAAPVDLAAAPAQALLAANLDASLFRAELVRLADERVQLEEGIATERARAAGYERESREWIAKLEADVAQVQAELAAMVEQRNACEQARGELAREHARVSTAFGRLPRLLQRALLRTVSDGRA